jgi:hypothetical protein
LLSKHALVQSLQSDKKKMNMRYFSLLLLFFLPLVTFGQNPAISTSRQDFGININTRTIEITPEFRNTVLPEIARGNGRALEATSITLQFSLNVVHEQSPQGIRVLANVRDWRSSGDVLFRGFNLGDLLVPEQINMNILTLEGPGNIIARTYTTDLNQANQYRIVYNIPWAYPFPVKLGFRGENAVLIYSPSQTQAIMNRCQTINDYYAVTMMLDEAMRKLNLLPPLSPDNMDLQSAGLQEADQTLQLAKSKNYPANLVLSNGDPSGFLSKLSSLEANMDARRMKINSFYASLDAYYYNKGLEALNAKKWGEAERLFQKSVSINPRFAPAAYEIAQIKLNNDDPVSADLEARMVWFNLQPDPVTYQKTSLLFKDIYMEYLDKAERSAQAGQWEAEMSWLEKAQNLCREVNGIPCTEALYAHKKRAREKQFNALVNTSYAALSNDVDKARKNYQEAEKFNKDELGSERNQTLDSLRDALEIAEMEAILAGGEKSLEKKNFTDAANKAGAAVTKLEQFNLNPGERTQNRIANLAYPQLRKEAEELVKKVQADPSLDAEQQLRPFKSQQKRFFLEGDPELKKILFPLEKVMIERECRRITQETNDLMSKAKSHLLSKNYIMADDAFLQAIEKIEKNPNCNISKASFEDERMKHIGPATYQKLINQIIQSQVSNTYTDQIETKYKAAEKYFFEYNIDQFGLTHKPYLQFAIDNFRNSSLQSMAISMRKQGKLENALELYKIALSRGASVSFMSEGLYDLGEAFGDRDYKAGMRYEEAKVKVDQYTNDNPDLKRFKKGYLSTF